MIGKHRVIIEADKVNYNFEVKRNITIIQGDSASGKTTLVDLIRTYGRYKEESGISMVSDVPCVAFSGDGDNCSKGEGEQQLFCSDHPPAA